jgi:hypothetical protein
MDHLQSEDQMSTQNKTGEEVDRKARRVAQRSIKREAIANRPSPTTVKLRHLEGIARVLVARKQGA